MCTNYPRNFNQPLNSDPSIQEFLKLSDVGRQEIANAAVKHEQQKKLERLRDEFAMAAMGSRIMLEGISEKPDSFFWDLKKAYMYADAALKARESK